MQPHQQRVAEEKENLDGMIERLHVFITENIMFLKLPKEEQVRLKRQIAAMAEYSHILGERIAAF